MVVASIDLQDGKAVQLRQGRDKVLEHDGDVLKLAETFDRYGEVAVIDLDAAMGKGDNRDLIRQLCARAQCRVGGGIRSVEQAKELVSWGARRIIVGSKAFEDDDVNEGFLRELSDALGRERVQVAVDARDGEIVTKGWTHRTGLDLLETAWAVEKYAASLLFTSVEQEGTMQGADIESIAELTQASGCEITAAGGVATLEEIQEIAEVGADVQLGMALYTGEIDLDKAFVASLAWEKGVPAGADGPPLLPVVTQDEAGRVLMQAWVSRDALMEAFGSGKMTYFSRSRGRLWTKGETSGHIQDLVRLRADCDSDAILATVRQTGPACHTGRLSCFGDEPFRWDDLHAIIANRLENAPEGSYTARLRDSELLRSKILEEAQEVVEAETPEDIAWEAADVLYFVTVLLAQRGLGPDDVLRELRRRRWAPRRD